MTLTPPIFWNNAVDGDFGDGSKWSDGRGPLDPEDNATIDLPGSYTITLDSNVTHKNLHLNGAGVNVELDLAGNSYTVDDIFIGGQDGDNVSLTFADSSGIVVSAAGFAAAGGPGQAANGDPVGELRARLLEAGKGGHADVDVKFQSTLGKIDSGGSVDVEGTKGQWTVTNLSVGTDDEGTLKVFDRGSLITTQAKVGENRFSDASVEVTGQNSLKGLNASWTTDRLVVGDVGEGVVLIKDRAKLIGDDIVIGDQVTSIGRITLDRASLSGNAPLPGFSTVTVGSAGLGTLEVKNESRVDVDNLYLGFSSGGSGRVAVDSSSEVMVNGEIRVGGNGAGNFTIEGGEVQQTDVFGLTQIGPNGILHVLSGHFHERRRLFVNGDLLLDSVSGSAAVGLTILRLPGHLVIGNDGILFGNGVIFGDVRLLAGGDNQFGGTLAPSTSPGTLTIDGNYEQLGGTLEIEMAGTAPGQFDVLKVTGNADLLGGRLLLAFIDGFAPQQGDEFMFLDVDGALSGAFADIQLRGLRPGFQFDVRPDAGGLSMIALNDGVAVPEPASMTLLIAAMLVASFRRNARGCLGQKR